MSGRRLPEGITQPNGRVGFVGRWTDAAGKRRWRRLGRDLATAVRSYAEILRQRDLEAVGLGEQVKQARPLEELRSAYLDDLRLRSTPAHVKNTEQALRQTLKLLDVALVKDVTIDAVQTIRKRLLLGGDDAKPSSKRTANKKIAHLQAMLRWAAATNRIIRNPIEHLEPLPEVKARVRQRHRLTLHELNALLVTAEADDARRDLPEKPRIPQAPLLRTVAYTGFRWGEAVSLRWADLSSDGVAWRLRIRAENSKTGEPRTNPIPNHVVECLNRLRTIQGRVVRHLPADHEPIFLTATGDPWNPWNRNNSLRWLNSMVRQTKSISKRYEDGSTIDWHAMRHTYAQMLRDAGVDLWTAQSLLGHRDPKLTAQIYSEAERAMVPKVDAVRLLPAPTAEARPQSQDLGS